MEPRFGHDFSQVRVHTDLKASESARALNAFAYTQTELLDTTKRTLLRRRFA